MNDASFYILTAVTGLIFAIFCKKIGKSTIEFRKKMFGWFLPESAFGKSTIIITQIGSLLVGILVFLISIYKLFR